MGSKAFRTIQERQLKFGIIGSGVWHLRGLKMVDHRKGEVDDRLALNFRSLVQYPSRCVSRSECQPSNIGHWLTRLLEQNKFQGQ